MSDPVSQIRTAISQAVAAKAEEPLGSEPALERPPKPELGDYSTNAAMLLAPVVGASPREIAEDLASDLTDRLGDSADRIEVAGPGFLNVFLAPSWYRGATAEILEAGDRFGAAQARSEKVLLEFVSANPTGPLTAAGGRHAAFGDSLARVLEFAGFEVERQYYVNDSGGQIDRFAASIAARMAGGDPPEDGYAGAYIAELAKQLTEDGHDDSDLDALGQAGVERMRAQIAASLEAFRVSFDSWVSERGLYKSGAVEATMVELESRGHLYDSEGARWLRTTDFGDDKDRVVLRDGGEPTYFAADIAHHRAKFEDGADQLITVLGADHHGYVSRLKAVIEALGHDQDAYEAPIMQLVHLVEGGERAAMSKRKGDFATLDELVNDIGVDAARFFMVQRSHDTTIDLDLALARERSSDNPVYYVQYAHARICQMLTKAGADLDPAPALAAPAETSEPLEQAEQQLIKRLLEFPSEVTSAAERRAPHRIATYAGAVAADFHAFYRDCPVVDADEPLRSARIGLCVATRRVIASSLGLLGVSAPEQM